MKYEYEELLDRAWSKLPEKLKNPSRFEVPKTDIFIEGNQTIIRNFSDIASRLGRKPQHIFSYLLKELAAPGVLESNRAIIQRRLRAHMIDAKIEQYAEEFVLCHECKRPDTTFTELEGEKIVKCEACGGWRPLRKVK
jgi:translation initiation factor 2 subunit 2